MASCDQINVQIVSGDILWKKIPYSLTLTLANYFTEIRISWTDCFHLWKSYDAKFSVSSNECICYRLTYTHACHHEKRDVTWSNARKGWLDENCDCAQRIFINSLIISLQICRNGMLKFRRSFIIRYPQRFPGPRNEDLLFRFRNSYIIAPYWLTISDDGFEQPINTSKVFYRIYSKFSRRDRDVLDRANHDVRRFQTSVPQFEAQWVLVVTWLQLYSPSFPGVRLVGVIQSWEALEFWDISRY